ncbi:MAG: CAP domain-containing protein, partial [Myxococcales bacterium]|nr:CAP domain-containing protein [Myxococcales bacterium]
QDCGACPPRCGDGACDANEACDTCPQDCGACPPRCGDGRCEAPEDCGACPQDCGQCGWPEDLARSEEALLELVNQQRAVGANCGGVEMGPANPLTMNAELREAARLHSQDMGENNYFSHTGLNGSNFSQRASAAGYRGFAAGENIAAGNGPAQATFNQWLNSPGHCQNMLRERFREIGVGHAAVPGSQYTHYWTQVFGQ